LLPAAAVAVALAVRAVTVQPLAVARAVPVASELVAQSPDHQLCMDVAQAVAARMWAVRPDVHRQVPAADQPQQIQEAEEAEPKLIRAVMAVRAL